MLGDISRAEHIYVACGYTDMRKSIDGLAAYVKQSFQLDPFSNSLFLFCGHRRVESKPCFGKGQICAFVQALGKRQFSMAQKRQ